MNYKTVLVHLDDSDRCDMRRSFAIDLALRHDAHLIGLYVVNQDLLTSLLRVGDSLRLAEYERQIVERRQRAEAAFEDAINRAGCHGEWRAPAGPALDAAVPHARHADLVILGQRDPDDPTAYVARHFTTDLLMNGGRPVLILPYARNVERLGEHVLIAWDGSREAARAVADALPLMRHARCVTVETILVERDAWPDDTPPGGVEVVDFLARHRIDASFSTTRRDIGVRTGGTLLNRINDLHADLLVAGAYGHMRLKERVLGGVTRTLLESMTVPVLLSH